MDVTRAEEAALERLRTTGDVIVDGVASSLPGWVAAQVGRVLDAWGTLGADERARADADARLAGAAAAARVVESLCALLGVDPAEQSATPLEVVRTATQRTDRGAGRLGHPAGGARRVRGAGVPRRRLRHRAPHAGRSRRRVARSATSRLGNGEGGRVASARDVLTTSGGVARPIVAWTPPWIAATAARLRSSSSFRPSTVDTSKRSITTSARVSTRAEWIEMPVAAKPDGDGVQQARSVPSPHLAQRVPGGRLVVEAEVEVRLRLTR